MKRSQLKSFVKSVIREMYGDEGGGDEWNDPEYRSMVKKHFGHGRGPEYHKLKFPCPDCGTPNAISQWHKDKGYHCDSCTKNLEGPMEEDHALGYSHNVEMPDPQGGDRDPLNDPILTGKPLKEYTEEEGREIAKIRNFIKTSSADAGIRVIYDLVRKGKANIIQFTYYLIALKHVMDGRPERIKESVINEAFRFNDFNWLSNMSGFGTPTDVYWDTIYLGTIESTPDGDHYKIVLVDTPKGKKPLTQNEKNKFKSKNLAAEMLHKIWKFAREAPTPFEKS